MKYLILLLLLSSCGNFQPTDFISGQISAPVNGDTLTIRTFKTQAGAIGSLTFRGVEYVDPTEHGASLQSASSYDGLGEKYNPTEAGTSYDGPTDSNSHSVLLELVTLDNTLITYTNMALWERWNGLTLNNEYFSKKVAIGYNGLSNVIEYNVNFYVPQPHAKATFEALTGYMPINFTQYYSYNLVTNELVHLTHDGSGLQSSDYAVITATGDGKSAMAGLSLSPNCIVSSWGDSQFWNNSPTNISSDPVNKWNLVFLETNLIPQTYSYQMLLVVGTIDEVVASLKVIKK